MDYFRNFLGTPQGGVQPTGAETVERLTERVSSSTLLDDRRDAVRALKALSKKFRLEVGTQSMGILINVLEQDRNDAEITGYALDTLCNIMSNEPSEDDEEVQTQVSSELGEQFTEIFIKKSENVSLLLSLLEEYDFHVRWPTVKLLTVLLTNKSKDLQECILVSPMGVSKLMDLLSDSREIIRNDALLLLIQLTKGNANIQKIVAFENAFERLLEIIRDEGNSDGGIVVEDCLLLLLNLLKNNVSNQNFFKEGSYIQKLEPYFDLDAGQQSTQGGWSAQKVTNIHLMLQLVRTMVSPNNPQQQTTACQKVMNICGLLQKLCSILMASGVPADVLTETINTVSEVIRGSPANQEHFASVLAPSNPPRPAIVVLLMSMVNEKQPFLLRCAVLYCFQSFLYKNEVGQSQIVQTLLPTTADVNTITAGQLLCGGLFSGDSLSNWFAATAMLHAILENSTQKEQLLRVQLATSLGNPPVSLLQQCCNMLAQGGKVQTRIGLLMLMCGWMSGCAISVSHFLSNSANVPYLISQVSGSDGDEQETLVQGLCAFLLGICIVFNDDQTDSFTKSQLRQIIEKRIGLETFTDRLSQVLKNESYTRAAKRPHLNHKQPSEVLFDYEFTRLFKSLETDILRSISDESNTPEGKKKAASIQEHEKIVDQYKELITEQDGRLKQTQHELEEVQTKYTSAEAEMRELREQVQQLKDKNALYKATKGSKDPQVDGKKDEEIAALQQELNVLKDSLEQRDAQIQSLENAYKSPKEDVYSIDLKPLQKNELTVAEARVISQSGEENKENNPNETAVLQATLNRLSIDHEEVKRTLSDRDTEIVGLKAHLDTVNKQVEELKQSVTETPTGSPGGDSTELQTKVDSLLEENKKLQERIKKSNEENLKSIERARLLEEEKERLHSDKLDVQDELETVKKEQEDLLVLLADNDTQIDNYKAKLKALGQTVDEDDDDDEDLDDLIDENADEGNDD